MIIARNDVILDQSKRAQLYNDLSNYTNVIILYNYNDDEDEDNDDDDDEPDYHNLSTKPPSLLSLLLH